MSAGRRLPDAPAGSVLPHVDPDELPGGYWRARDEWYCGVPARGFGVGRLSQHEVTEHDDGTITVAPSILVETGDGRRWHGYLERGDWRALPDTNTERPA